MNRTITMKKISILFVLAGLLISTAGSAQQPPRWVQRGVAPLNRERTNDSYRFEAFSTPGPDRARLAADHFRPLLEYVGAQYEVDTGQMQLDSLPADGAERTTYRISFPHQGQPAEVYAQLVDDWMQRVEEIDCGDFELHQLYAVSERNAVPAFDSFTLTERYPAKAAWMSVVPGLGQIYKGQRGKGYAILGTEAVLIGGIIYSAVEMRYYNRLAADHPEDYDSYRSNVTTFRQLRNVCLVAGGTLYLYNLIDAAVAKGSRRVVVRRFDNRDVEFAFVPVVTGNGAGVGLCVKF